MFKHMYGVIGNYYLSIDALVYWFINADDNDDTVAMNEDYINTHTHVGH